MNLREIIGSPLTIAQRDANWAIKVTESSHTKAVGEATYPTSGTAWSKAQGNAESTRAVAIVSSVPDANTFWVVLLNGAQVTVTAHGLGATGTQVWLSQSVAGGLTATKPTGSGIAQPVAYVLDTNTLIWQLGSYEVI